jgi:hypothetical protein
MNIREVGCIWKSIVTQKSRFGGTGIILASIGLLVKSEQEVFRVDGPGELQVFWVRRFLLYL